MQNISLDENEKQAAVDNCIAHRSIKYQQFEIIFRHVKAMPINGNIRLTAVSRGILLVFR